MSKEEKIIHKIINILVSNEYSYDAFLDLKQLKENKTDIINILLGIVQRKENYLHLIEDSILVNKTDLEDIISKANEIIDILFRNFNKDYYEILGVNYDASQKEIRDAWIKLIKYYHPDKIGNENYLLLNKVQLINEAYSVLSDNQKRVIYNKQYEKLHSIKIKRELFNKTKKPKYSKKIVIKNPEKTFFFFLIFISVSFISYILFSNYDFFFKGHLFSKKSTDYLEEVYLNKNKKRFSKINVKLITPFFTEKKSEKIGKKYLFSEILTKNKIVFPKISPNILNIGKTEKTFKISKNLSVTKENPLPLIEKKKRKKIKKIKMERNLIAFLSDKHKLSQISFTKQNIKLYTKKIKRSIKRVEKRINVSKILFPKLLLNDSSIGKKRVQLSMVKKGMPLIKIQKRKKPIKKVLLKEKKEKKVFLSKKLSTKTNNKIYTERIERPHEKPDKKKSIEKTSSKLPTKRTSLYEKEIKEFITNYINAYKIGDINHFISFYSKNAIEGGKYRLKQIKKNYELFFKRKGYTEYILKDINIDIKPKKTVVTGNFMITFYDKHKEVKNILKGMIKWEIIREKGALKIKSLNYSFR